MLRLLALPFVLLYWLLTLPLRLLARSVPRGAYLLLEIDGPVVDFASEPSFIGKLRNYGAPRPFSLHGLADLITEIEKDPRVAGIAIVMQSFGGGMATATAMREAIKRARATGREVVVHLPQGGGTKELYVALAANRVFLGPQATLASVGFLSTTRYLRRALDKAGLVPEVFAAGRFKSAGEQIARDGMSEQHREQTDAILDGFHGELLRAIEEGRRVDGERARALIDGAPYRGVNAVNAGLVDGACYEDELPDLIGAHSQGARPHMVPVDRFLRARRALRFPMRRRGPVVAVIPVHGAIAPHTPFTFVPMAIDDRIIGAIRQARASRGVRGVVLHVDSPGGSALASDRIHHELEQLAKEKPLVAYFSDVAASGGYYVGAAAHEIIAQSTTITGSIGVVSARMVFDPLLTKIGIVTEVLKRGARARLLNATLPFDAEEKDALEAELRGIYRGFLEVVARGRKRPIEEIELVAEGRVWTGTDALAHGLVDKLGTFEDALASVRTRIGAGAERMLPVILRGPRKGFPPLDPPKQREGALAGAIGSLALSLGVDLAYLSLATRERVIAWSPEARSLS